MVRRTTEEIQTKDNIPQSAVSFLSKTYPFVPSLVQPWADEGCPNTGEGVSSGFSVKLHHNTIREYSGPFTDHSPYTRYHRDNYSLIPTRIPPMSFSSISFSLDDYLVVTLVDRVSTNFNIKYDRTYLNNLSRSFASVVITASEEGSSDGINFNDYMLYPTCYDITSELSPLDILLAPRYDISDEYAYMWEDVWDMVTVRGNTTPTNKTTTTGLKTDVALCQIVTPPSGNGGTAIVRVISVSGSGAVSPGASIAVNVPSI